jgi:hypothetical protein
VTCIGSAARVSVVGSRAASDLGLANARDISRRLAERGVIVVSGLAVGIDSAAHEGAMDHGGRTIAVLGTSSKRRIRVDRSIRGERRCVSADRSSIQPRYEVIGRSRGHATSNPAALTLSIQSTAIDSSRPSRAHEEQLGAGTELSLSLDP